MTRSVSTFHSLVHALEGARVEIQFVGTTTEPLHRTIVAVEEEARPADSVISEPFLFARMNEPLPSPDGPFDMLWVCTYFDEGPRFACLAVRGKDRENTDFPCLVGRLE